jgi:hypothetical protein
MRLRSPSLWPRVFLGIVGAASFAAGAAAVFKSDNGTGTGVLIAFGGVMLALAVLGDYFRPPPFTLSPFTAQDHHFSLETKLFSLMRRYQRESPDLRRSRHMSTTAGLLYVSAPEVASNQDQLCRGARGCQFIPRIGIERH